MMLYIACFARSSRGLVHAVTTLDSEAERAALCERYARDYGQDLPGLLAALSAGPGNRRGGSCGCGACLSRARAFF